MKHIRLIILLWAVAALSSSCLKETEEYCTYGAYPEAIEAVQEGWGTKSSLDGTTGMVYWSPKDAISVFFGETGIKYVSANKEKAGIASFVCSPDVIGGSNEGQGSSDGNVYGLYPFNIDASQKDGVISTTLQDVQTAADETFSNNLFITIGKASVDKLLMGFYNVCGGIRFRVTTTGITSVKIKGNNGETLAGDVNLSFGDDGYPRVAYGQNRKTEIILNCEEGFKTGVWYYMVSLPVELTKGYTLTFSKGEEVGSTTKSTAVSIRRSMFGSIDNADADIHWSGDDDEPMYVKVTSEPESWDGTYLIVDETSRKAYACDGSGTAVSVTISDEKIDYSSSISQYAVTITDAGVKHSNGNIKTAIGYSGDLEAYNVRTKTGQYLYCSSSSIQIKDSNTSSTGGKYYHTFRYDSDGVYMTSSKNSSGSSYYFFRFNSSSFSYIKSTVSKIQLYKFKGKIGPTPSGTVFNIERNNVSRFLDDAYSSYTNTNGSSKCVVKNYCLSSAQYNAGNRDDVPAPVSLTWDGTATSVSVFDEDVSTTEPFKTVTFTSSQTVDVFNLIPGKTYTYKVNNEKGTAGSFKTEGRRRMIKVSNSYSANHANNCRDFGGIKTADGRTLKYGLMFRGTNMDEVTDEEKQILVDELGIKLDVDLRESGSGKDVSPIGVDISNQRYQPSYSDLTDSKKMKVTVSDVLTYVSQGKPVYIHCRIGSDRTGYVCMLLEALLGVSLKECDIDYELTSFAGGVTAGSRTRNSGQNGDFRKMFITNTSYTEEQVPQAVEDYVINTLGISRDLVNAYRKAMGAVD